MKFIQLHQCVLYVLKLCSLVIQMWCIANSFPVTKLAPNSKQNNILAMYPFLWQLKLHIFNYTVITYWTKER